MLIRILPFNLMRIRIQLITLMRIRIQLITLMRNRINNTSLMYLPLGVDVGKIARLGGEGFLDAALLEKEGRVVADNRPGNVG